MSRIFIARLDTAESSGTPQSKIIFSHNPTLIIKTSSRQLIREVNFTVLSLAESMHSHGGNPIDYRYEDKKKVGKLRGDFGAMR
jgi:hypothetical protein